MKLIFPVLVALLFAVLFGGVGLFTGSRVVGDIASVIRMKNWQPMDARIDTVVMRSQKTSKGSATYSTITSYRYQLGQTTHHGTQIRINDADAGYDNVGSYQEDWNRILSAARNSGEPLPGWYNPDKPNEAVLTRDLRTGMLWFNGAFMLVFGGVGLGALVIVYKIIRSEK